MKNEGSEKHEAWAEEVMATVGWPRAGIGMHKEGDFQMGPYLNDVYKIFRILDPLPPLSAF